MSIHEKNMIIVAGASGEIGSYLSKRFFEEKYQVSALDKVSKDSDPHGGFTSVAVDFSDEEAVDDVWKKLDLHGEVTLLNLIGSISSQPLLGIFNNWETQRFSDVIKDAFQVNFFNVVSSTMSFVRFALLNGIKPHVINFGSISSKGVFGQISYGSAKAAVQGFSRVASVELGAYGVRINCVMPGYVDTPRLGDRISVQRVDEVINRSTTKKLVSPEDIFLATKYLHDSKTLSGVILEAHSIYGL